MIVTRTMVNVPTIFQEVRERFHEVLERGARVAAVGLALVGALAAADGDLDTSYGVQGVVSDGFADLGGGYMSYGGVFQQADGRLVLCGGIGQDLLLARYTAAGARDASFATGGAAAPVISNWNDGSGGVLVQPDRSLILVGTIEEDFRHRQVFIARYTKEGYLDTSFGSGGRTFSDVGGSGYYDTAWAVAVARQDDGKLVMLSDASNSANGTHIALTRYLANGAPDPTFGSGGTAAIPPRELGESAYGMLLQPDGSIVLAGESYHDQNNPDAVVIKLRSDGSLDPAFGTNGEVRELFGANNASYYCVARDARGRLVVGGRAFWQRGVAVTRYLQDGSHDASFGSGGTVLTSLSTEESGAHAIVPLADGRVLVGGSALQQIGTSNGYYYASALLRLGAGGALDPTFGAGGSILNEVNDGVLDLEVLPDGRLPGLRWTGQSESASPRAPSPLRRRSSGPAGRRPDHRQRR